MRTIGFINAFLLISFLSCFAEAENFTLQTKNYKQGNYKKAYASQKVSKYEIVPSFLKEPKQETHLIKNIALTIEGIDFQENIDFLYTEYLHTYVDAAALKRLNRTLTQYFLERDYLLPQITINFTDLKQGILNIRIRIESFKDVIIIGKSNYLIEHYAKKILEIKPSSVKNTQKYIALMGKIPGFKINYKIREDVQDEEAKKFSSIDLVILTEQGKGDVFAGFDNYGLNELGKMQTTGDVQFFSPFTGTDAIALNALTTNHPDRIYDVGVRYDFALNKAGSRGSLIMSHIEDNPTLIYGNHAKNSQQNHFSFVATHPLYITLKKELLVSLASNYHTLINYDIGDFGSPIKIESDRFWSEDLGFEYSFNDSLKSDNIVQANFIQGIDGRYKNYQDPANIPSKYFNAFKFNFFRVQDLPQNFSIFTHFALNYSAKILPDQEMFTLGGREFGRGYDFGTLDGTKMIAFAFETRYSHKIEDHFLEELQPYSFIDTGKIGKQEVDTDISSLSSFGAGLRFKMQNNIDFTAEVAQPLNRNYKVEGSIEKSTTRLNLFLNKVFRF